VQKKAVRARHERLFFARRPLSDAHRSAIDEAFEKIRRALGACYVRSLRSELQIGRGSVYWWGAHGQTPKRIGWTKFTKMMNTLAYGSDD
jgi:hypothetical protein